mgnify:CR=1 FL=1
MAAPAYPQNTPDMVSAVEVPTPVAGEDMAVVFVAVSPLAFVKVMVNPVVPPRTVPAEPAVV